ncbi:MAG: type II toxin-antitoxin system RelE/ParE family toxin [Rhodocyclaceae bacterium]|nr:type II toxin-antitoxin system RelE/ParE family toxin [Rhodocyclaceae bacterium]
MTKLRWLADALSDLEGIRLYIAQDSPAAARRVVSEIRRQVQVLREHPLMGRVGLLEGTRELVIGRLPYIVAYRVQGDHADILAVVHTSRKWPFAR